MKNGEFSVDTKTGVVVFCQKAHGVSFISTSSEHNLENFNVGVGQLIAMKRNEIKIRKADIEEMETIAAIISAVIEQRNALGYSQRQLAEMCNMPQSSIARIESCKTVPNLETLVKMMKPLGLTLTAQVI